MDDLKFPAEFTVHWVTGPTHACVKHARGLQMLGSMLGGHVPITKAPDGSECANCVNEAKANAGVAGCPESGKHCRVVDGECQTCGLAGVKEGGNG